MIQPLTQGEHFMLTRLCQDWVIILCQIKIPIFQVFCIWYAQLSSTLLKVLLMQNMEHIYHKTYPPSLWLLTIWFLIFGNILLMGPMAADDGYLVPCLATIHTITGEHVSGQGDLVSVFSTAMYPVLVPVNKYGSEFSE